MEKNEDLLNLNQKKDFKKPLIIGAGIFVLFVAGVIAFGIMSNKKEENNVVAPPKQDNTLFKEVPIEENQQSLTKKLLQKTDLAQENPPKQTKPQPLQEETNPTPKEITKPTQKPQTNENVKKNENKNYYIQVAALMKTSKPNPKFLQLIEKNGFSYKIMNVKIQKQNKTFEVKKILIGPFTKEEVKEKLKEIKAKINQNAFIFRIK